LSRAGVTTVAALTFATETVLPAAVGLVALGDRVAPGRAPWTGTAFVVTLAGCIALASRAEPGGAGGAGDPDAAAARRAGGGRSGSRVSSFVTRDARDRAEALDGFRSLAAPPRRDAQDAQDAREPRQP
ncbi:MAG: hypothetical protein ACKOVB_20790, partial [Terrabacter sp.]